MTPDMQRSALPTPNGMTSNPLASVSKDPKIRYKSVMEQIKWVNLLALTVTPLVGLYGAYNTPLQTKTLLWSIFLYTFAMLGEFSYAPTKKR